MFLQAHNITYLEIEHIYVYVRALSLSYSSYVVDMFIFHFI